MKTQTFLLCFLLFACGESGVADQDYYKNGMRLTLQADSLLQANEIAEGRHTYNLAIADFERVLQYDKKDEAALCALAFCRYRLDDYKEAADYYEAALQLNPDLAMAKMYLGFCFVNRDELETGRAYLNAALEKDNSLRPQVISELIRIGQSAYSYKDSTTEANGNYQRFAIGVMLLAWGYSPENPMVKTLLRKYGEEIGDQRIVDLVE